MPNYGPSSNPFGDSADSKRRVPALRTANERRTEDGAQPFVGRMAPSEPAVFWRVWEQYRTELYRCCLRWMGGDPHEAKEALNSIALKLLHKLPCRAHEITSYKYWLLRLTYTQCMDIRRGHRRYAKNVTRLEEYGEMHSEAVARDIGQPEQVLLSPSPLRTCANVSNRLASAYAPSCTLTSQQTTVV